MTKEELEKLLVDFVIEKGLRVQILDPEGTSAYHSEINALTVEFYYEETEDEQI
jgi:hypothetical protein